MKADERPSADDLARRVDWAATPLGPQSDWTPAMHEAVHGTLRALVDQHVALAASGEAALNDDDLRQAQKMEAFGQLTGGIAHDFNNILQAVSGSLEMLGRKYVHNDDGQRLLRQSGKALGRAAHLTRQLLAFARKQALDVKPIDVDAAIAVSVDLAMRSLPAGVTLVRRDGGGTWPVLSDANQLDVAILNLVINARDAMPDGGTITVSTTNVTSPAAGMPAELAPGDYVRVMVEDDGVGIPEAVRKRVFEPFFTTKDVGKGTGLGLSQVYGFARQSGGTTGIDSRPGEGTRVSIYLPRSHDREATAAEEARYTAWQGRETILVVDDDEDVRELTVTCLKEFGYRVLDAASGIDALETIGREASIDLLLIDYAMPDMNGAETVRLARRVRPHLAVLFITGYADLRAVTELVGPDAIVQKPFKLVQLVERVGKSLSRRLAATPPRP